MPAALWPALARAQRAHGTRLGHGPPSPSFHALRAYATRWLPASGASSVGCGRVLMGALFRFSESMATSMGQHVVPGLVGRVELMEDGVRSSIYKWHIQPP